MKNGTSLLTARIIARGIAAAALLTAPASAQQRSPWYSVPPNAIFETGDTWTVQGTRFRLYGVQSCLRGTSFTNEHGLKRDCGEASLSMLVALNRDLKPLCYTAAQIAGDPTQFVICFATMKNGKNKGARVDLGMSLITLGYAFGSLKPDGTPVHQPYFEAHQIAKRAKAGLWAYSDLPEPNDIILRAYNKAREEQSNKGILPSGQPAADRARPAPTR